MRNFFTPLYLLSLMFCLISGCVPFTSLISNAPKPKPSIPTNAKTLAVKSSEFLWLLDEEGDETHVGIEVKIDLGSTQGNRGTSTLILPKILRQKKVKVQGVCKSSRDILMLENIGETRDQIILDCPAYKDQITMKISYEISWQDVPFYQMIEEANHQYRILNIPADSLSDLLVTYQNKVNIPYRFRLSIAKSKPLYINGVGHNEKGELMANRSKDEQKTINTDIWHEQVHAWMQSKQSDLIEYRWEVKTNTQAPNLFFVMGDWSVSPIFYVNQTYPVLVLSGYGTHSYRIQGKGFHHIQQELISTQVQKLLKQYPKFLDKNQTLMLISYPSDPTFTPPNLEHQHILFIPETWFYRQYTAPQSQPILERTLVARQLLQTCIQQFMPQLHTLAHSIAEYLSVQELISNYASSKNPKSIHADFLEIPLYVHDQMKRYLWLLPLGKELLQRTSTSTSTSQNTPYQTYQSVNHQRLLSHKLRSLFDMLDVELIDKSLNIKKGFKRLFLNQSLSQSSSKIENFQQFLSKVNHINPTLKGSIESYMLQDDLPLIKVKWQAKKQKNEISVTFSLSQKPMNFKYMPTQYLSKKLWNIPVCLKWGQKEADPIKTCVMLKYEQQNFTVRLPSKPTWVYPNTNQTGLYYWTLDQQDYQNLLQHAQLNQAEWSSLIDLTLSLVLAKELEVDTYLNTLDKFVLQPFNPVTLSLLFEHLNHVVRFFATPQKGDTIRTWASAVLQGVMLSENNFKQSLLSHLTQLQLLQWEDRDSIVLERLLSKKEHRTLNKFLRDESSYDPLESTKFDMAALQYPLLLKAYVGNQKLWQKIYDKFLSSDNQLLMRIVCLQALAQFQNPVILRKSLDLLTASMPSLLSLESDASQKLKEEDEEDQESKKHHDDKGNTEDQEGVEVNKIANSIALKSEDVRILVKSVKSNTHRRIAWQWLQDFINHDRDWEQKLIGIEYIDIRYALAEWAQSLCSQTQLQKLTTQLEVLIGHKITHDIQAQQIIQTVRRCVYMRNYQNKVRSWFMKKL